MIQLDGLPVVPNAYLTAAEEEYARRQSELEALKNERANMNCWRVTPAARRKYSACRAINQRIKTARHLRNIAKRKLNQTQRQYGNLGKKTQRKDTKAGWGGTPDVPPGYFGPPPSGNTQGAGLPLPLILGGAGVLGVAIFLAAR